MKSGDRIVLAWCDPGMVDGGFAANLARLYAERSSRIGALLRTEGGLITRQRNETVATFLRSGFPWLMMVDSDELITVEAFDKLCAIAHDQDRPAVAGLVFAAYRGDLYPTPIPTLYVQADDGFYTPLMEYPADSLVSVDSAGGGFWMVHRTVLEAIQADAADDAKSWCWFREGPVDDRWLSEDHYFWRQVRGLGFPIVADTGAVLQHRKRYLLDDRHYKEARNG